MNTEQRTIQQLQNHWFFQDEFDTQAKVSTNSKLATIVAKKGFRFTLLITNNYSYGLKIFKETEFWPELKKKGSLIKLQITLNQ